MEREGKGQKINIFFNKIKEKIKKYATMKIIAYTAISIGIIILIIFGIYLKINYEFIVNKENEDLATIDNIGGFIGGVVGIFFSLASVLLIIENLKIQKKQIENQKVDFDIQILLQQKEIDEIKNNETLKNILYEIDKIINKIENCNYNLEFIGMPGYYALEAVLYKSNEINNHSHENALSEFAVKILNDLPIIDFVLKKYNDYLSLIELTKENKDFIKIKNPYFFTMENRKEFILELITEKHSPTLKKSINESIDSIISKLGN